MKVVLMHRTQARWEAGEVPAPQTFEAMGALMGEMAQQEIILGADGLRPSSEGVRLRFAGGQCQRIPGPFGGGAEVPAGFVVVRTVSLEEAVRWASRFADSLGDVEIDIRPFTEAWDLGFMPKPEGLTTTRYMLLHRGDRALPVPPELVDAMQQADVYEASVALHPTIRSQRLRYSGEECRVTDGPYAEAKELIGGYCLLQVPSLDVARHWADRFAGVVGDVEIDLRLLLDDPPR